MHIEKKRIVVDANVLISTFLFKDKSHVILESWSPGSLEIVLFEEILHEYSEVVKRLSEKDLSIDISGIQSVRIADCSRTGSKVYIPNCRVRC